MVEVKAKAQEPKEPKPPKARRRQHPEQARREEADVHDELRLQKGLGS